ncbi:MAG: hypothetical protein NVSMB22_26980 [Chloroflexota bacterium]
MPNVNGQAFALSMLTPIVPGREAELKAYLESLASGPESPLERTGTTHFARWVIIDQLIYEGEPQKRDTLHSQYLLFDTSFDGADLDAYVENLCRSMPAEVEAIWGRCAGYPDTDPEKFKAYVRNNQIDAAFFVAAYPEATVMDVRDSLALREQFTDFAMDAQALSARDLRDAFRAKFLADGRAP